MALLLLCFFTVRLKTWDGYFVGGIVDLKMNLRSLFVPSRHCKLTRRYFKTMIEFGSVGR